MLVGSATCVQVPAQRDVIDFDGRGIEFYTRQGTAQQTYFSSRNNIGTQIGSIVARRLERSLHRHRNMHRDDAGVGERYVERR